MDSMDPAFVSDGCTWFFNVWRGIDLTSCCVAHDLAWFNHPLDWGVFWSSNIDLAVCFAQAGAVEVAIGALIGVTVIGGLFLFPRKRKRNGQVG